MSASFAAPQHTVAEGCPPCGSMTLHAQHRTEKLSALVSGPHDRSAIAISDLD
jgi:hypothetical protein